MKIHCILLVEKQNDFLTHEQTNNENKTQSLGWYPTEGSKKERRELDLGTGDKSQQTGLKGLVVT